jgi:hypothetical protein
MRRTARQTHANRTITVDFQNEATYFQLLGDGKAFMELVWSWPHDSGSSAGFVLQVMQRHTGPVVAGELISSGRTHCA